MFEVKDTRDNRGTPKSSLVEELATTYGTLPAVPDYRGARSGPDGILILGQDPSISTRSTVTAVLMLDEPTSELARYVTKGILTPLGLAIPDVSATNLVPNRFPLSLSTIATRRGQTLTNLVASLSAETLPGFRAALRTYKPKAIIALGRPVLMALSRNLRLGLAWNKRAVGSVVGTIEFSSSKAALIPCVHIRTYKRWEYHRTNQPLNLRETGERLGLAKDPRLDL